MAKDTREILSGIRVETATGAAPNITTTARVFGVDEKDELAAALTPEQGQRLLESGAINGDWTFTGTAPEPEAAASESGTGDDTGEVETLRSELATAREVIEEGTAENERQQGELEALRSELATVTDERDELKRQNSTLKGQLTRLKNQSGEGAESDSGDAETPPA